MQSIFEMMDPITFWVALGVGLLFAELFSGKIVLLFFSIGALLTALARGVGLQSLTGEILFFVFTSISGLLFLRKPVLRRLIPREEVASDIGRDVPMNSPLEPQQTGEVTYQGVPWTALNVGDLALQKGERALIVGKDGNRLLIKKSN